MASEFSTSAVVGLCVSLSFLPLLHIVLTCSWLQRAESMRLNNNLAAAAFGTPHYSKFWG